MFRNNEDSVSPLLTAHQAAAILGVCRSFMTHHAVELHGRKVGRLLKFARADIDAYLARVQVTDPAQPVPAPRQKPVDITKHRHAKNPVTGKNWESA